MGDGYISKRGLRIRLQIKDKEHLDCLVKCLNSDIDIKIYKNTGFGLGHKIAEFTVNNKFINQDLYDLGFKNGIKSGTEFIPESVKNDKELFYAFLLGLFDADGSTTYREKIRHREFNIISGSNMILDLKNTINNFNNLISFSKDKIDKRVKIDIATLRICNKISLIEIYKSLYKLNQKTLSDIYLKRKKEKFDILINSYKSAALNSDI